MSEPITPSYIKQQLKLDPRASAAKIVALRNAAIGFQSAGAKSAAQLQTLQTPQAVEGARSAIESIRRQFWSLPLDKLNEQLSAIDLRPYPELANVVDQLQHAAAVRAQFPKLAQRLSGDLVLFQYIKQSITSPPRDVAGMKESIMRGLLSGDNAKSYKTTAKIIKEEFPGIYALQHEWYDDILAAKKLGRDTAARSQEFTLGAPSWIFAILFLLLVRGCVSIMR